MDLKLNLITIFLVTSILISVCAGTRTGIDSLRARLRGRFPNLGRTAYVAPGYGSGSAAAAAAAAGANGYGGAGSAAAAAAAVGAGANRYAAHPAYEAYPEEIVDDGFGGPVHGGSSAAATGATGARPSPYFRAPAPIRPAVNLDSFRRHNVAYHQPAPRYVNRYPAGGSAAAAAAAAAAGGAGYGAGGAAASSAAVAAGGAGGHVTGGETAASTGTYANSDHGKESSSYRRSTENLLNHEDGHVDDNHYYNAQSYGKTDDENMHEAYNKDDEDIEQTPNLFRKKKSGENYVLDYNKARRESGSGVLAKDKHSSAFNKNSRKFIENVDQKHKIRGNGIVENVNHVTSHDFDDDDEEIYDSDGLDGSAPSVYHGSSAAAAAAAAAGANGGSVASSAGGAAVH